MSHSMLTFPELLDFRGQLGGQPHVNLGFMCYFFMTIFIAQQDYTLLHASELLLLHAQNGNKDGLSRLLRRAK